MGNTEQEKGAQGGAKPPPCPLQGLHPCGSRAPALYQPLFWDLGTQRPGRGMWPAPSKLMLMSERKSALRNMQRDKGCQGWLGGGGKHVETGDKAPGQVGREQRPWWGSTGGLAGGPEAVWSRGLRAPGKGLRGQAGPGAPGGAGATGSTAGFWFTGRYELLRGPGTNCMEVRTEPRGQEEALGAGQELRMGGWEKSQRSWGSKGE